MELETIILCEVSQKKTNTTWYHSYVESNYKNKDTDKTYLQNKNRFKDIKNKFMVTKGEMCGEG